MQNLNLSEAEFAIHASVQPHLQGIRFKYDILKLKCRSSCIVDGNLIFQAGQSYVLWAAYNDGILNQDVLSVSFPGRIGGYLVSWDIFGGRRNAVRVSKLKIGECAYAVAADFENRLILVQEDRLGVRKVKEQIARQKGEMYFYTLHPRIFASTGGMFIGFLVVQYQYAGGRRKRCFCYNSFTGRLEEPFGDVRCEIPIGVNQKQIRWGMLRVGFPAPQEKIVLRAER